MITALLMAQMLLDSSSLLKIVLKAVRLSLI
jgi:hypothetical protein